MFSSLKKIGRIETIDFLKLFASLLVIFCHSLKFITNGTSNPLFNFIWLTQMPLFMFTAGFVNDRSEKVESITKYLHKTLKNSIVLLVPCITFLLITCALNSTSVISALVKFFYNPETNLWFLWTLFVIHLIFDFGMYLSCKNKSRLSFLIPILLSGAVTLTILVTMFLFRGEFNFSILSIKLIAYYTPFFCLGYLFRKLLLFGIFDRKNVKTISVIVLIIFALVLIFECVYFDSIYSFDDYDLTLLVVRIVGSTSSIAICCFLADLLIRKPFVSKISKYGSFSLQSYYLHLIFLHFFQFSSETIVFQWIFSFSLTLILILLVIATIVIMYFIPFFHLLLFGKSFSFYDFEKKLPRIFR